MLRSALFSGLALALTACDSVDAPTAPETGDEVTSVMSCPVRDPKNIEAWIDAMPGLNDNPTLHVQFTVTAPTPGYSFKLGYSFIKRTNAPVAQLRFVANAPEEPTIQVETDTDLHLQITGFYRETLDGLEISCGGEMFISLEDVVTAY